MQYGKMKRALSSVMIAAMLAGETLPAYAQDVPDDGITAVSEETPGEGLTEGIDYVPGRLLAWTDSEEQALALAEAYEGELLSWEYGSTLIAVDEPVAEALKRSIPEGLPKAEPDYIIRPAASDLMYTADAADPSASGNSVSGNEGEAGEKEEDTSLPERRNWEYWYDGSANADPYLNPADNDFQWFHSSVDSFASWGVTTGKKDIRVVLIGSGVDAGHEDLAGANLTVNDVGEVGKEDKSGNGTHAAALIAGQLKNGKGGAGIAPGVQLLSICVMDDEGVITESRLSAAIGSVVVKAQDGSAAGRNAEIIDFSDITGVIPSETEAKAIKSALDAGITVIAGVGDEGSDALTYPAAYDGVIRVGAAEKNGAAAVFSNKCSDMLYAPGVDIFSARKGGGYQSISSSNSAAAIVTGMAALYMSAKGYVKPEEMKKALKDSVKDGTVNMAKLFEGSTEAPNIAIYDGEKLLQFETYGKGKTPDYQFTGDSTLTLASRSFSHDSAGSRIIYTTNGKAPKVEDGKITEGQLYTEAIPLLSLCEGTKEQTITIQAVTISGMGVLSDPSTLSIKVLPEARTELAGLEIVDVPEMIVPGKDGCTLQLKAKISGTITSPVIWKIESADVDCDLDEKTGLLKVNTGNAGGEIFVSCYAERPKRVTSETVRIVVNKDAFPVMGLTLQQTSLSMFYSSLWDEDQLETESKKVEVLKVTSKGVDGRDIDLLNNGQYLYLRWTSSNEKVIRVEPSEDRKSVKVIPVGAGTAKVVCTAMDGSGVSASAKVTVKQYVESFNISGPLYVLPGKSYTYKASKVLPDTVEEKGVTWRIVEDVDWASVNLTSGLLTVKKTAEEGDSLTLEASAKDGSGVKQEVEVKVVKKLSKAVVVSSTMPEAPYYAMKKVKKTGCITSLNLFTKQVLKDGGDPTYIILSAAGFNGEEEMEGEAVWSCSDPTVVSIEEVAAGVKLKALKPGSVTLTCTMNDGSAKKAKVKVKVMDPVEGLELSGQTAVAKGASATFKASSYLPAKAGMKKVEWSLVGNPAGVTVSTSGKVKVTTAAALGTVTLLAKAKDGCGTSAEISFLVVEKKTKSFDLKVTEQAEIYDIKTEKKSGALTSLRLFNCDMIQTEKIHENRVTITSTAEVPLKWTSSDDSVVQFEVAADGRSAVVKARKSGTATVTVTAADGSNKKKKFKLNVVTPASDLRLQASDGQDGEYHFLACGKSVDLKAALGRSYGKPTTEEVKWRVEVVDVSPIRDTDTGLIEDWDIEEKDASETKALQQLNLFTFKDGKLTTANSKDITSCFSYLKGSERNNYPAGLRVVATTTDGTELEAEQLFILTPVPESLCICKTLADGTVKPMEGNVITLKKGSVNTESYLLRQKYKNGELEQMVGGASVSSSAPDCVSASYDAENGILVLRAIKESEQPVTITIKAKDGSGKSVKYTVKVS